MGTFLGNRWDIDYNNKRIFRDTATDPTITDTSLALYSALQDLFDEPDQMDDPVPMSAQTPTEFSLINGWFLDDESTQYLTGGAIQSIGWGSGANTIRAISYDATTGFSTADIGRTITGGTTGDAGVILAYDDRYVAGDQGVVWIRPTTPASDLFDNGTEGYTVTGSSAAGVFTNVYAAASGGGTASEAGDSLWANIFTLGTLVSNTTLYVYQDGAELIGREVGATNRWWGQGQIDILVKVRSTGNLIDDAEITVFARQYSKLYDNFTINLSTGGRQPVPLATGGDLNNTTGYRQMVVTTASGDFTVGEVIEDNDDDTTIGVVTSVSGTAPNLTIQYYLIGPALADFGAGTGVFTGLTSLETATAVASTAVGPANLGTPPTVVFGATDQSLGGGQAAFPYSISIDGNANTVADIYEFLKYETGRGRVGGGSFVFDAEAINGEAYTGSALQVQYSSQTGAFVEGEEVYLHDSGNALVAKGTIVGDHDDGTTGDLILRNVRFYTTNIPTQVGDNVAQGSYTDFATVDSTRTITTPKSAPFGTFAGGTFFGAPGVFLFDVNANDVQAFQLTDDDGNVQNPPNFINAQVTSLNGTDFDRVAVFVLTGAGGSIDKAQHGMAVPTGAFNGQGDTQIRFDATIPNDTPESGVVRVVDNVNNVELRFRYASFTGTDITLSAVAEGTGATSADATGTTLTDTTANFTNATDDPQIGDIIYNITDVSWGVITSIDSATVITHTPLQGGTGQWDISDTYAINAIPYDLDGGDTAYIPLIDAIASGGDPVTVASANFVYLADIPVLIRVRNGGSADPIIPFQVENTVTSSGLVQAAIRTSDTIAT